MNNNIKDQELLKEIISKKLSLRNILNIFIDNYDKFINGYKKLRKLENFNEIFCYGVFDQGEYVLFDFYCDNKSIETDRGYLNLKLSNINGEYKSIIYNNSTNLKKRFCIDAGIKEDVIKEYMDFFKEYKNVINAYHFFRNEGFGRKDSSEVSISFKGDFLEGLESIDAILSLCSCSTGDNYYFQIDCINDYKISLISHVKYGHGSIPSVSYIESILDNTMFLINDLPELYKINEIGTKKLIKL